MSFCAMPMVAEKNAVTRPITATTVNAMGAHPFILWTLMIPLLEERYASHRELQDDYAKQLRPFGRPDFGT